jgi:hypothetical protein
MWSISGIVMAQASVAIAQTAPQTDSGVESGDIIVTANKREENLNKVGLTITAISGEALSERGISSLEDIAAVIPGLAYSSSTANTPIFTLRGVGFQESSLGVYPAVSVYFDQTPLAFPIRLPQSPGPALAAMSLTSRDIRRPTLGSAMKPQMGPGMLCSGVKTSLTNIIGPPLFPLTIPKVVLPECPRLMA